MNHVAMLIQQQPIRTVRASGGSDSGCGGTVGCFGFILIAGVVLYFILKGKGDRAQVLGASHRPMGSGPLQPVTFTCPYPKCPTCGGSTDKMKQNWDGMRKVTWVCGYCSATAGVQELKDEELPASARQRLGLDPAPGMAPGMQSGYGPGYGNQGGGGIGNLLTGMMIGSMMSGDRHHHHGSSSSGDGGWTDGSSSTNSDWGSGDASSSDWGGDSGGSSDSGGDWGGSDSGGSDSGGSDW